MSNFDQGFMQYLDYTIPIGKASVLTVTLLLLGKALVPG
jgi:hypothetical protein